MPLANSSTHFRASIWQGKCAAWIAAFAVAFSWASAAAAQEVPLSARYSVNARGDIALIGNSSVICDTADPACLAALAAGQPSNSFTMFNIDVDSDGSTFNSSQATLTLPAGVNVLYAGLYWAGTTQGSIAPPNVALQTTVLLDTPASAGYLTLTGSLLGDTTANDDSYAAFVDITSLVQAAGSGSYTVANVQLSTGTGSTGPWGGWSIAVVYNDPSASCRNLTVFDGYENFFFGNESVTLTGFEAPATGPVAATLGFFMGDGDRQNTNPDDATDTLLFEGTTLSNALNPTTNFFNNTITEFGANVTSRDPVYDHTLVIDIDRVDASGILPPGSTSATVTINSNEGLWWPLLTMSIEAECPELAIDKAVSPTGPVSPGDTLTYTVTVDNVGGADATDVTLADTLPPGVTYVGGSAQKTYPVEATGTYNSPNLGPDTFSGTGTLTQSLDTTGLIPAGAVLLTYGFNVNGAAINGSWLSEIELTATYPSGTAYTLPATTFGGNGSGAYNVSRGPGGFAGPAEGLYQFQWSESFDDGGVDDNQIDSTTFSITYSTGRASVTDAAGAPPAMVTSGDGITLEPGESLTVTFQVTVDDPPPGGTTTYINSAAAAAEGLPAVTDDASNLLDAADVAVTKTLLTAAPWVAGQLVTYEIVVTNNGPVTATGVQVADTPSNLVIQSVSSPSCSSFPCTIASLGAGASETLTVTATVTTEGPFTNLVTVAANELDLVPSNNSASTLHVAGNDVLDCQFDNAAFVSADQTDPVSANNSDLYGNRGSSCSAIEGTVWLDEDGDGVLDVGETGIGGVTVYLCAAGVSPCDSGNALATTLTDAAGNYGFPNLPAGDYQVQVDGASAPLSGLDEAPGNLGGNSGTLELDPGEVERADFGYEPAAGTAVIAGTVWSDADADADREPGEVGISGVTVRLLNPDGTPVLDGGGQPIVTVTAADGSYTFTGVAPGEYIVGVDTTDPDLGTFCSPVAVGSCNTTPTVTVPVTVDEGDAIGGLDFGFDTTSTSTVSDAVWYDADGDGVLDPGEELIAGVTVDLIDCGTGTCDDGDEAVVGTAITGANGEVRFTGVPDGDYRLQVTDNDGVLTDLIETTGTGGSVVLTVAGADVLNAPSDGGTPSFGYNAPGTIGDLIWSDADGDGVRDPGEAGLGGVLVELLADTDGDGIPDTVVATTTTAADGTYLFEGYEPGAYSVRVASSNFLAGAPLAGATQTYDADGLGTADISTLTLTGPESDLSQDFGYRNISLADVSGTVFNDLDADGVEEAGEAGIPGVTLTLSPSYAVVSGGFDVNGDGVIDGSDDGLVNGITVIDGGLDLNGDGVVDGNDDGTLYGLAVIDGQLDADGDGSIGVGDTGTVLGDPIATTTTDANGDYLFPDLPDGDYVVSVTDDADVLDGYQLTSGLDALPVTVAGSDVSDVDFGYVREPATGAIGDVLWLDADRDGLPDPGEGRLSGVTVELYDPGPDGVAGGGDDVLVATTTTDALGRYVFDGLAAGNYYVDVDETTLPAGLAETAYPAGVDPSAMIPLSDGERYEDADFGYVPASGSGVGDRIWFDADGDGVQDAGEVGIEGVEVTVSGPSGTFTVTTGADGLWYVPGLAPGEYIVEVDTSTLPAGLNTTPTNADVTYTVQVQTGVDLLHLDWGFDGGTPGSIGDRIWYDGDGDGVQDAGEAGIEGVTVNLLDDLGRIIASTTTGADGSYDFTGLAAGDYTVQVSDIDGVLGGLNLSSTPPGTITLAAGQDYDLADFGYAPSGGTGSIGSLVWRDVDGSGTRQAGEPGIEGVTLDLWLDVDGNGLIEPGVDNLLRTTTTDANGEYEFTGLPFGSYLVDITDEAGVLAGMTQTFGTPGVDDNGQVDPYAVVLSGADPSDATADFGYEAPFARTIQGTAFEDDDQNGSHQEPGEATVEGVTVRLYRIVDGQRLLVGSTVTGADGDYVFTGLPDGAYEVEIDPSGSTVDGWTQTTQAGTGGVQPVTLAGADSVDNDFGFYDQGILTTPVSLASFESGSGRFAWTTATEVGNLGFHLHALESGGWRRLNDRLIPSGVVDSVEPQSYELAAQSAARIFVLEDVDVLGRSRFHGPFEADRAYGRPPAAPAIDWLEIRRAGDSRALARRRERPVNGERAELLVEESGIHRVTYEDLAAAGVELAGVAARDLALTSGGMPQPIHVEGGPSFGPGSAIEFLGEALDSPYSRTRVYRLEADRASASRVEVERRPPQPILWAETTAVVDHSVEEQRAYSFASPLDDPWYDGRILAIDGPVSETFALDLPELADAGLGVELTVGYWGGTDFPQAIDHHLVLEVNGVEVAEDFFDGVAARELRVEIGELIRGDGSDHFRIVLPHDTGAAYDLVNYDRYSVRYTRRLRASGGRLDFDSAAQSLEVDGLADAQGVVYRRRGSRISRLEGARFEVSPNGYAVRLPGDGKPARYQVADSTGLIRPAIRPEPRFGPLIWGSADLLVISHADFLTELAPWVSARQAAGLVVRVVDVEAVYQSYAHGMVDPEAIRAFVQQAAAQMGVRYLLLVGGDTYDPLDHLGQGALSFVPTLYSPVGEIIRFAPSDALYGDLDGDGVEDLPVGRLPVRTPEELTAVLAKILAYDSAGYRESALLGADARDATGYSFSAVSDEMAALLPRTWSLSTAYVDEVGLEAARTALMDALEAGTGLVSYIGHSGPGLWSFQGLLTAGDIEGLAPTGRAGIVSQWGCWTTYHVAPTYDTLGHRFLLTPSRGAAAVLGAVALTEAESERRLGRLLFAELGRGGRLGDAVVAAKQALAAQGDPASYADVLRGWALLGDPTMRISP